MSKRIAINGFGRIGRIIFKILQEYKELEIVAINDILPTSVLADLLENDYIYGKYDKYINHFENTLVVENMQIKVLHFKDIENLPWRELSIDIVFDCTGLSLREDIKQKHIRAGAKNVIIAKPSSTEDIINIFIPSNNTKDEFKIIPRQDRKTMCIFPLVKFFNQTIGIKAAILKTNIPSLLNINKILNCKDVIIEKIIKNCIHFNILCIADIILLLHKQMNINEVFQPLIERQDSILEYEDKFEISNNISNISLKNILDSYSHPIIDLSNSNIIEPSIAKIRIYFNTELAFSKYLIKEALNYMKEIDISSLVTV